MCKVCRAGGRKAADEFCFEDVNMLNDTGGVEQAVIAMVRAAWMKFTELSGILCM